MGKDPEPIAEGAIEDINSTVPVAVAGDHTFVAIHTGGNFNCALDTSGQAWCWGELGWWGCRQLCKAGALFQAVQETNSSISLPRAQVLEKQARLAMAKPRTWLRPLLWLATTHLWPCLWAMNMPVDWR